MITNTTQRRPAAVHTLARATGRQRSAKVLALKIERCSGTEALQLLAMLRGRRYRTGYDHGVGCHNVDEVTAHFLTTIPRSDAVWLKANYDAERQDWPTRSLLIAALAERDHTMKWRRHLAAATGYAAISDHLLASVRCMHQRLGFGDEPKRATIEQALAAMENENMFGLHS
jgi:hypothetical protein